MSLKINIIGAFFLLVSSVQYTRGQNEPPVLTAVGEQVYCPLSEINVVTEFDIVDDDTEIAAVYIQISTGYDVGFDTLELIGNHPNIVALWNAGEGKLTLEGNGTPLASYTDLIVAVKDVVFKSTSNDPSEKFFSFTIGDANYLPRTGHYYEYISAEGISWADAKVEAENRSYFGLQGYLATILYPEEAQLTGEQAAGTGWIGGSDVETEGVWKWVTGPETGLVFWNGGPNGSTPNYANWNTGEPNNMGDEDYAHVTAPGIGITGSWNDLKIEGDPPGDYHPKGYIVEYGGFPDDPELNISASTHLSVVKITETFPNSRCGSGEVELQASASIPTATALWFDALTGGNQVGSGLTFTTPVLNTSTTYYVLASESGCEEGERIPVVATIYEVPVIQQNIVFKNCDEDGVPDGYTDYNLEEVNDIITYNNSEGLTITYHETFEEADSGISAINPIYNNSEGNTVFARVENADGCYDISTIDLQVSTTSFPQGYVYNMDNCDDDDIIDGKRVFDLTQASDEFLSQFLTGQNLSVHYFRTFEDAQLEQNEILNQSNFVNEEEFSQLLYVRVESDDNGDCYGLGPHLQLIVHPRPEFEVGQSETYCSNGNPVTLFAFNASGDFLYEWIDEKGQIIGDNSQEVTITSGGTYTVVATSEFDCESFPVSYSVFQSEIATITLDDISIVELSDNNSITIDNDNNNLGIGNYEFALDDINGPYQDQPFFDHVGAGSHMIYVRDKNACGIAELEVFILGFPKFFTPNNDGDNDTWQVRGIGTDFTNSSVVNVFDRYGKLIKQLNAKNGSWDGTFNGQPLADSDYWFVAELIEVNGNIRTYRGHFSLVR